jgi:hypothetical protein
LLAWCFGGCNSRDVLAELRRRGLLDRRANDRRAPAARTSDRDDAVRTARALAIWREARSAVGTIVESYLRSRGLFLNAWPAALRFHPTCSQTFAVCDGRLAVVSIEIVGGGFTAIDIDGGVLGTFDTLREPTRAFPERGGMR